MARIDATLREARSRIDATDAQWLLAHALRKPRSWLFAHAHDELAVDAAERFASLLQRRADGEPVAYLTGRRGFWRFDLQVTPATLIPRPETELLVELALARLPDTHALNVLDLGTGSGAIALALASERPHAHVIATDVSADALAIAQHNARDLRLTNIEFRAGDWFAPLAGVQVHLIASNPPYIADDDAHLGVGDLRHEPRGALASGQDGLDAIRAIASAAPRHLVAGGWLLLEHGGQQGDAVRDLLCGAGFIKVETARDLENRDRVTFGRMPAARIDTHR